MINWIKKLYWDEIEQVSWRTRLEKLTCAGSSFVFNPFLYLEPVQKSKNVVRIGTFGNCSNSTCKSILDVLKAT